jgi:hypothetical protein
MAIVYVGIDLAKNVFAVHGVDEAGKPALVRPSVPRESAGSGLGQVLSIAYARPHRYLECRWAIGMHECAVDEVADKRT